MAFVDHYGPPAQRLLADVIRTYPEVAWPEGPDTATQAGVGGPRNKSLPLINYLNAYVHAPYVPRDELCSTLRDLRSRLQALRSEVEARRGALRSRGDAAPEPPTFGWIDLETEKVQTEVSRLEELLESRAR